MAEPILRIENLSKSFRSHWTFLPIQAVSGVSFEVFAGEAFGFLGHNGAGKTTTIKSILGLIHKTEGNIIFRGKPLVDAHQRAEIGYLPELPYFYDHLTVEESLDFFASLHGIKHPERGKRVREILERVGLADRSRSAVRSLSKGLQQRLGMAQAIINRPALLLLDEPQSGLDPLGRAEMRNLILELKRAGTTIFLSSHILPDVEEISDRVAIMAKGKLRTVFPLSEAPKLFGESFELRIQRASNKPLPDLEAGSITHADEDGQGGRTTVYTYHSYEAAELALHKALHTQLRVEAFRATSSRLEDIFLKITKEAGVAKP